MERLRKEETNLKGDQAKFLNWIKIHEEKSKKMEDGNGKLREALRMEGKSFVLDNRCYADHYFQTRRSTPCNTNPHSSKPKSIAKALRKKKLPR